MARPKIIFKIFKKITTGQLLLPALPNVSIKIRKAAASPDSDMMSLAKIAQADPAFCAHIIKLANSPAFRGVVPIKNVQQAFGRLGLKNVRFMAMSFATKSLFRCQNDLVKTRLNSLWERSVYTAALSQIIAKYTQVVDSGEAMLGGLMQDIGALALLTELSNSPHLLIDDEIVSQILDEFIPIISIKLMQVWELGEEFEEIARSREQWTRDVGEQLELPDIVLLAKYHTYLGTEKFKEIPLLSTLPVYRFLGDIALGPEASFLFLKEAKEELLLLQSALR